MKKVQYALRNINILNMMLLAVSVLMFFTLAYPLLNADIKVNIPQAKEAAVKQEENVAAEKMPTALDYVVVTDKNLFHPERKMPLEKKEEQAVVRPEIIFYGAIITGEKKIAYIEDKRNPYSTPGRGKRQTPLAEGAMIGGYTLKEVNPESIVLVRGGDKMIVNLRDQKDRKPDETTGKQQMPFGQFNSPSSMPQPGKATNPIMPRPSTTTVPSMSPPSTTTGPPMLPARPIIK